MKNLIILLIAVFSATNFYCQQNLDSNKEKEAIISLIERETQSYYDKDFKQWSDCYVPSDDNIWMSASKNGHTYRDGWKTHADDMKSLFDTEKEVNREVKKPIIVKIYDKSAWIVFENEAFNEKAELTESVRVTYFLEKSLDEWKITYSNRIYTGSYYSVDWPMLNMIAFAKSLGKTPEDIGNYFYEDNKDGWGPELGYDDYQNFVVNNYTNSAPPGGITILEQDDNHLTMKATGFAWYLEREGTLNDVSYEEYLEVGNAFWKKTGDHFGANYSHEIIDDGIKISVIKKK